MASRSGSMSNSAISAPGQLLVAEDVAEQIAGEHGAAGADERDLRHGARGYGASPVESLPARRSRDRGKSRHPRFDERRACRGARVSSARRDPSRDGDRDRRGLDPHRGPGRDASSCRRRSSSSSTGMSTLFAQLDPEPHSRRPPASSPATTPKPSTSPSRAGRRLVHARRTRSTSTPRRRVTPRPPIYGACPANNATTPQFQTVTISATAPSGLTETLRMVVREIMNDRDDAARHGEDGAALELALIFLAATRVDRRRRCSASRPRARNATAVTRTSRGTDYDADAAMQVRNRDDAGEHDARIRRRRNCVSTTPTFTLNNPSPADTRRLHRRSRRRPSQRHVVLSRLPDSVAVPCPDANVPPARRRHLLRRPEHRPRRLDPVVEQPMTFGASQAGSVASSYRTRHDEYGFTLRRADRGDRDRDDHLRRARGGIRRRAQRWLRR